MYGQSKVRKFIALFVDTFFIVIIILISFITF